MICAIVIVTGRDVLLLASVAVNVKESLPNGDTGTCVYVTTCPFIAFIVPLVGLDAIAYIKLAEESTVSFATSVIAILCPHATVRFCGTATGIELSLTSTVLVTSAASLPIESVTLYVTL